MNSRGYTNYQPSKARTLLLVRYIWYKEYAVGIKRSLAKKPWMYCILSQLSSKSNHGKDIPHSFIHSSSWWRWCPHLISLIFHYYFCLSETHPSLFPAGNLFRTDRSISSFIFHYFGLFKKKKRKEKKDLQHFPRRRRSSN